MNCHRDQTNLTRTCLPADETRLMKCPRIPDMICENTKTLYHCRLNKNAYRALQAIERITSRRGWKAAFQTIERITRRRGKFPPGLFVFFDMKKGREAPSDCFECCLVTGGGTRRVSSSFFKNNTSPQK